MTAKIFKSSTLTFSLALVTGFGTEESNRDPVEQIMQHKSAFLEYAESHLPCSYNITGEMLNMRNRAEPDPWQTGRVPVCSFIPGGVCTILLTHS